MKSEYKHFCYSVLFAKPVPRISITIKWNSNYCLKINKGVQNINNTLITCLLGQNYKAMLVNLLFEQVNLTIFRYYSILLKVKLHLKILFIGS